ncbi:flagellar basal body L-ring protein FlgH [Glaciimonas sp. CA11.2]|uniref:flagellar basal body L-ring protein FlgH n=1 Tax=unclassified Glaciimonas TaxID=2644401 RepID=UPI002AB46058|nr:MULTISPECIES: flagellar basal body L-ring protein FlgH [unclassified Glaciimonas]MDY7548731.1 flagellar basal body L-ring protein FlgH [Glaciimonas sp. CA11.2]MEB0013891.1 flagellar basal body L-ring protein FlgH [Glaciimonas sp. Cout2]MEB0083826.1 flagellar basal body L-ring protein FlgH [Glaciimonas sp. Gout2]MEB0163736.1 flagellar basal body L-ring protein FlgH [Glaciimonas sp. CA11.2]
MMEVVNAGLDRLAGKYSRTREIACEAKNTHNCTDKHSNLHIRLAGVIVLLTAQLAGCAQIPREPLIQQPMSARAEVRPVAPVNGSIFQSGYGSQALFEDRRPRNVGDILTIVVNENVNATKNSGTNASRTGSASSAITAVPKLFGGLFGGLDAGADGKSALVAKGGANAANTFNGVITVTVTEVLGNGNLIVSGEKQMMINQGTEFIRFSGVVNPRTVTGSNTVSSNQVADARIEYSAKGYIDEAQNMGWLQRFFLNVLPF